MQKLLPTAFSAALAPMLLVGLAGPAAAADTANPDWPCVQKKIVDITPAQFWDGPTLEGVSGWQDDEAVNELIQVLSSRRVPIAQAEGRVKKYAESLPEAERDKKLTLLFAGLFETIKGQRRSVITGLEKYLRAQRERAEEIERQGEELAKLEQAASSNSESDTKAYAEAQEKYDWTTRIFQERQNSIPVACEVPVIIDERIYALAKAIRSNMKQ